MAPLTDRSSLEAHVLNQEIVRLDTMTKQRIQTIESTVRDDRSLLDETKHTKDLIASLRSKIEALDSVIPRLLTRAEQSEVRGNVDRHSRELEENVRQLRTVTIAAKEQIKSSARNSLLTGGLEEVERRKRLNNQQTLKQNATKTTERLSGLVSRMNERVKMSEDTMGSLVSSSEVLGKSHDEFVSQGQHIQTGNKLLSKYERRELTDKILVTIALIFYLAVIYYILQKRVLSKFWIF